MALYDNDPLMGTDPYAAPTMDPFREAMEATPIDPGEPSLIDPAAASVADPFLAFIEQGRAPEQEPAPAPPEFEDDVLPEPEFEPVARTSFDGAPEQSTFAGNELQGPQGRQVDGSPELSSLGVEGLEQPETYFDATYRAADEASDAPLAMPEGPQERREYYEQLSPEALTKQFAEEDAAKASYFADQQSALLEQSQRDREASEQRYQLAREESAKLSEDLRRDIDTLASKKVNPGRWKESRTGLQSAAMYLTAALGGFLAPQQGGRNRALESFMKAIDQDINAQKFDLQSERQGLRQRQSLLGELRKTNADEFQADEAARIIRLKQGSQLLQIEASKYDPDGTAARRAMEMQQQLEGEAAARQAALEERNYKRSMEIADQDIARAKASSQIAKDNFVMEKGKWEMRRKSRRGPSRPKEPSLSDKIKADQNGYVWNGQTFVKKPGWEPGVASDPKAIKEQAESERARTLADREKRSEQVFDPANQGAALTKKDGTPLKAPTVEEAREMRSVLKNVQDLQRAADLLTDMREKYGGASKAIGSNEYQEMIAIVRDMDLEAGVRYKLGALSADDIKNIKDVRGGKDINSFIHDPTHGLKAMAKRAVEKTNTHLTVMGYDRKEPWTPTRSRVAKNYERSMSELEGEVLQQRLPHQDQSDFVRDRAQDIGIWVKRKPSLAEMRKMGAGLAENVESGAIDRDTAETLAGLMRNRYEALEANRKPPKGEAAPRIGNGSRNQLLSGQKGSQVDWERLEQSHNGGDLGASTLRSHRDFYNRLVLEAGK